MTIGIYSIYWQDDPSKVYIGQSLNIEKRWAFHLWELKNGRHTNKNLQEAYNKLGKPNFYILEKCPIAELLSKEIDWVNEFDAINSGYNIMYPDSSKIGYLAPNSKYSKLTLLMLFRLLRNKNISYQDISELTGVNKSTVLQISRNEKHTWLHEKYPNISKQVELARLYRLSNRRTDISKVFIVKDKSGTIYKFSNIYRFCKEHNLNVGNFYNMLHGKGDQCKGFTLLETAI